MSGGFGAGFLKGAVVSLVAAAALSLATPLPPLDPGSKTQVDLDTPAGSGFNTERRDTNPVLPEDGTGSAPAKPAPAPHPEPVAPTPATPRADTTPGRQPEAQGEIEMPAVTAGEVESGIATPAASDAPKPVPPALGVPMPPIDNPVSAVPAHDLPQIKPPVTEIETPPPAETPPTPKEGVTPTTDTTPGGSAVQPAAIPQPAATPDALPVPPDSALMRNRVPFDHTGGGPMMSVILVDAGAEGPGEDVLTTFGFPVTFALAPGAEGATARAKRLFHAGYEIVALAPAAASGLEAGDVQAALNASFAALPEAIGLVARPDGAFLTAPGIAAATIAALKPGGYALVSRDHGLNPVDKAARRAGLRSDVVYRVLDAERERAPVIKRYLKRAALEAGKTGHVIVLGRTYPETVTALFSWARSTEARGIAFAPASAAILDR